MTQIERLGLMRNPKLSSRFVVALLNTPSSELDVSRKEHVEILSAAAVNPDLVWSSRTTGRKWWSGGGEGNPPFEEYGEMWRLCLEKWINDSPVPYLFIKYIQTTPKVKLIAYKDLLEKRGDLDCKWLRKEVIRSCDPFEDKPVLKVAWDDPDDECRIIARERVGVFTDYVDVQKRKSG